MNKKILNSLKRIYYKHIYNITTFKLGLRFNYNFNKLEVIHIFISN